MANATIRNLRPKYLSLTALLFEIRLPLPGWASILHRISGLLLFLAVVWLLFMLLVIAGTLGWTVQPLWR